MSNNRYKNYGRRLQYRSSHGLTVRQYQKRFKYSNMLMGESPIKRKSNSSSTRRKLVTSKGKFKSQKIERKLSTSKGKLTYRSKRGQTVSEYVQSDLKAVSGYDLRKKDYPALGFNFKVTSTLSSTRSPSYASESDSFFQSISGIKATAGESVVVNSGVNNRQYKLPTATTYPDLVLTRGLTPRSSTFGDWCHSFLIKDKGSYRIQTRTINVMLLNGSRDKILMTWTFYDCYPKEVEIGAFNADKSELAIETLTLAYSYFSKQ